MGQGRNVEIVQALFDEFAQRRDDAAFACFDDEIVWDSRPVPMPELSGVFHGHDGVRRWWRIWLDVWERIEVIDRPRHHVNGNQVVSVWTQRNTGKGSGIEVFQETALIWTFEAGRIVRVAVYADAAEGLRAAGLEDTGKGHGRG